MNRNDYRWTIVTIALLVIAVMLHIDIWHIEQDKFDADLDKYMPVGILLIALYAAAVSSALRIGRGA